MSYIYLQNIKKIHSLLNGKLDAITWKDIRSAIIALYTDPDIKKNDKELYMVMEKYYSEFKFDPDRDRYVLVNNNIEFSLDGLISIGQILDIVYENSSGNDIVSIVGEALKYYEKIRKYVHGQVLFPCRQVRSQTGIIKTINQQRAANGMFDRIDYALADLKLHISGESDSCVMKWIYDNNNNTKKWLQPYKEDGNWRKLVNDMKWSVFVDENYEIWDFAKDNLLENYPQKREKPDIRYLENLCKGLKNKSILLEKFK